MGYNWKLKNIIDFFKLIVSSKNLILQLYSMIFIYLGLLWISTMILYDGNYTINRYNEGYIEGLVFLILGYYGFKTVYMQ